MTIQRSRYLLIGLFAIALTGCVEQASVSEPDSFSPPPARAEQREIQRLGLRNSLRLLPERHQRLVASNRNDLSRRARAPLSQRSVRPDEKFSDRRLFGH